MHVYYLVLFLNNYQFYLINIIVHIFNANYNGICSFTYTQYSSTYNHESEISRNTPFVPLICEARICFFNLRYLISDAPNIPTAHESFD